MHRHHIYSLIAALALLLPLGQLQAQDPPRRQGPPPPGAPSPRPGQPAPEHQAAAPIVPLDREVLSFNRGWEFRYEASSDWQAVTLPHDFQIHQPWVAPDEGEGADLDNPVANIKSRLSGRGFKEMGRGWYRKTLSVPGEWKGSRVLLDFEGILLRGDVYLNGERVGGTDYGYLGFEIDLSDHLKYGADNEITVLADTGTPDNSRWYTGGGIYRDVHLIRTHSSLYFNRHPLHITTQDNRAVRFSASITNKAGGEFTASYRILDPAGAVVAEKEVKLSIPRRQDDAELLIDSLEIANPAIWDCEHPNLYTLELKLASGDVATSTFGIRTLEYNPQQGFLLNGEKVLLKGAANHHTLGALGAAAHPRAEERYIKTLKGFGLNHIRSSHNPYSEHFLDICDREGILVVDELYDKWMTQYAGGRKDWTEQWVHDVPEWMTRDRNHPSVIMWSFGNELQTLYAIPFHDYGVTPYRMLKALGVHFDSSRPFTVAMHPRGRNPKTNDIPADLALETDIASYNYRYMYFPGDAQRYPWMMFYQSEASTSSMGPNFFEMDLDKVIGLAYWGAVDYLGESQGWPAKGWAQGVFRTNMQPKPKAWLFRSMYDAQTPVVHIGIVESEDNSVWNDVKVGNKTLLDSWNYRDGSKLNLYTFTNCDEVELLVNGKSLGRRSNEVGDAKSRNQIYWKDVDYKAGRIEAVGYRAGKEVCRHTVRTAGTASKLIAQAENSEWLRDGDDLQFVNISAVDRKGVVDPSAASRLSFSVSGPAEIIAVDNGDMSSDEMMDSLTRSLYRGRTTVILRSLPAEEDASSEVILSVSGEGFKTIKVKL